MNSRGGPLAGLWLVQVRLNDMSGLTVVEIEDDVGGEFQTVRVLGPGRGMYLFPTRQGLADFLASGEPHTLEEELDGVDVMSVDPEYNADFVALMDDPDMFEMDAAELWRQCLLIVDGCGIEEPPTVEDAMARVAEATTYRDDFEQPDYAERDYWMGREIQPVRLTLPSGSGVTLVALSDLERPNATPQPFLGDYGHVVLFHDPRRLLAYIRAAGTDDMRSAKGWPVRPPHCEPTQSVDVRTVDHADHLNRRSEAFDYLLGLAMVLTKHAGNLRPAGSNSDRGRRKALERAREVLREVNGKVTWC